MTAYSLTFAPHLPIGLIAALGLIAVLALVLGLFRRARGIGWRALFVAILVIALFNPVLEREERRPLEDIVVLVEDESPSQELDDRTEQRKAAAAAVRENLQASEGVDLQEFTVSGDETEGTLLFHELDRALSEIDRDRLAGVIVISDGQVHDVPDPAVTIGAPFHALITGHDNEIDRQVSIVRAPSFSLVDEPITLEVKLEELPAESGEARTSTVMAQLRIDGELAREVALQAGRTQEVELVLDKAGRTIIEIEVEERPGELTTINNRAVHTVNAVRDRLRVLLISGEPYPGLRVWRNLLKADPAVDLVHFTILRPPEKQDGTPIQELALIAFPARELFELKLPEFDLIIFDRYSRRGLLPLVYLDNVAQYVENGGALLEAAGPEFADPTSLYRTPLARVLPSRPSGEVFERGFKPQITEVGLRHPVTRGLLGDQEDEPSWGRWFRHIDAENDAGQVVMSGVADRPLLVLERVGEGRVAQLLSDQHWLWERGYEGGGPQSQLLRRLVHWLMQEPELEEEQLTASPGAGGIVIERRSLDPEEVDVTVTGPNGTEHQLSLEPGGDGIARTEFATEMAGLFTVTDGTRTTYVASRTIPQIELASMLASLDVLRPVSEANGGDSRWLEADASTEIRWIEPGRRAHGRGWIGLQRNEAYTVEGLSRTSLLPAWAAMLLLLALAAWAWFREGRA